MNEELSPMQVDTYRAIQAALKGYKVRHEKVPIIENIDNAKEAHATLVKIEITSDGYLKISNQNQFEEAIKNKDFLIAIDFFSILFSH